MPFLRLSLFPASLIFLAGCYGCIAPASAQDVARIEELVIFGRNTELLGRAEAASQGSVGGAD